MINNFIGQYSITLMCHVLDISRSGYYKWVNNETSKRKERTKKYTKLVLDTYEEFKDVYGARRIADELNDLGYKCSGNYIAKIMKDNEIKALNGRGFKYPKKSLSMNNVFENILYRNFTASKPNEKWTSDITYIWVKDKWMYLAVVMDLYSRKIVGWALRDYMTEDLIKEAFSAAMGRRNFAEAPIVHSDRGVQYRAQDYIDYVRSFGCEISMSRKGNCWDNAPMESFFSRLKVEMIYPNNYQTVEALKAGVFEYIEIFYNRKRKHSALGYVSPAEYEERMELAA